MERPVSDVIRRLSDELARDPSSLVFLPLGETLRRQGQLDVALKVALRGLERHEHNPEAHDLLARIAVDRGELDRAYDEWDMVLRLSPDHPGARKGMGFVRFRQGRLDEAERLLAEALGQAGNDPSLAGALAHVRAALAAGEEPASRPLDGAHDTGARFEAAEERAPAARPAPGPGRFEESRQARSGDARLLFGDLLEDGEQTALLLDSSGLIVAGAYVAADGHDVAQEVGAELSGVSDEARRAMRHLDLGEWSAIVLETTHATIAMAPAPQDGLLLVAAAKSTPLGLVRRQLERLGRRAASWLGGDG